jgi:hypothetical protein
MLGLAFGLVMGVPLGFAFVALVGVVTIVIVMMLAALLVGLLPVLMLGLVIGMVMALALGLFLTLVILLILLLAINLAPSVVIMVIIVAAATAAVGSGGRLGAVGIASRSVLPGARRERTTGIDVKNLSRMAAGMKKCPVCNLINPNTALFCDCGYDFEKGMVVKAAPISPKATPAKQATQTPDPEQLFSGVHWKRVVFLILIVLFSVALFGDEQTGNFMEKYSKYLAIPVFFFVIKGPWEALQRAREQDKANRREKK